jgi:type IV pilus assembly protein PilF
MARYEKSTRRFAPEALAIAVKIYDKQFNKRAAKNYAAMLVKMFPNSYESKQYLLNNLANIEADQLAQEYKLLQDEKNRPKKRVVVLKPNEPAKEKPVIAVEKPAVEKTSVAETNVEAQNKEVVEAAVEPIVEKVVATEDEIAQELANAQARKEMIEKSAKDDQREITLPIHVVAKGDSLFSISKKYNIHMKDIERWNGISRKNVLKLGQVLYLANPTKAAASQE